MQRILLLIALLLGLAGSVVYFWPVAGANSPSAAEDAGATTENPQSIVDLNEKANGNAVAEVTRSDRPPPPPELEIPLPTGSKQPVMVGRILNAEGQVGKNLDIRAAVRVQAISLDETRVHDLVTDGLGRFQLYLGKRYRDGRTRVVTFEIRATKKKPRRTAVIDLSHPVPPGIHDLGDVVLTVPPAILEGQLVDSFGVGIEGASIRMERLKQTSRPSARGVSKQQRWELLEEVRADSNANGFFTLHGADDPGDYRIVLSHDLYEGLTQQVSLHEPYLVIKMQRQYQVQGTVLLNSEVESGGIRITAYREATKPSPDYMLSDGSTGGLDYVDSTNVWEDGFFQMTRLVDEKLTFVVHCEATDEELQVLKDVPMQPKDDLMVLQPIDLRGYLSFAKLKVVSFAGHPLMGFEIATSPQGPWNRSSDPIISVISKSAPLNIYLRANGHHNLALEGIRGKKKVVMEAGITATIELTGASELPQPIGFSSNLHLAPASGTGEATFVPNLNNKLHLGGTKAITFPDAGVYALDLSIYKYGHGRAALFADYREIPQLTIADVDRPQHFVIDITAAQLASAIERLEAQPAFQSSPESND